MFTKQLSQISTAALLSLFFLVPALAQDTEEAAPSSLDQVLSPESDASGEIDIALDHLSGRVYSEFSYERPSEKLYAMAVKKRPLPAHKQRAGAPRGSAGDHADLWELRIPADNVQRAEMTRMIQRALQTSLHRTSSCWERVLLTRTVAQGSVLLSVVIRPDGSVERVQKLHDDINNEEFSKCLMSSAKRLKVAQSPGERITVTLPLQFMEKQS